MDVNVGLAYIAPSVRDETKVGRWGIEEKFGIGYFKYRESAKGVSESLSGFGGITSWSEQNIICLIISESERI